MNENLTDEHSKYDFGSDNILLGLYKASRSIFDRYGQGISSIHQKVGIWMLLLEMEYVVRDILPLLVSKELPPTSTYHMIKCPAYIISVCSHRHVILHPQHTTNSILQQLLAVDSMIPLCHFLLQYL